MKKTFLKFLGGAVAAIMLTTGLAVGMTTTALAATKTYTIGSGLSMPSSNGNSVTIATDDDYTISYIRGGSSDSFASLSPAVVVDGASYTTAIRTGSNYKGCLKIEKIKAKDKIKVVYGNQNKDQNTFTISNAYNSDQYNANTTATDVTSNPLTEKKSTTFTHEAKTAGTYYAGFTASKGDIYAVIIEQAPKGTGSIKGTVTGIEDGKTPTGKFTYDDTEFTVNYAENTYEITGLVNGSYEIKYVGTDYSMDPVTVEVTSQDTPVQQDLNLTKLAVVNVNGTVTSDVSLPDEAKAELKYGSTTTTADITDGKFTFEGIPANSGEATVTVTGADKYTITPATVNIASADVTANVTAKLNISGKALTNEATAPDVKYTFTGSGELQVSSKATSGGIDSEMTAPYYFSYYTGNTAPSQLNGKYSDKMQVTMSADGAYLHDEVTNYTLYLDIPLPQAITSGKVTVEAVVKMPKQNGSWNIMSIANSSGTIAAVRSNDAQKLSLYTKDDETHATPLENKYTKNQDYTVKLVLDNSDNSVSAYVDGTLVGEGTGAKTGGLSYVRFVTAGGTRDLYVKSVSVTSENDNILPGEEDGKAAIIKGADGTYYAVVIVSKEEAQANSALNVKANDNSTTIDTVYDKVVIDDKPYSAGDLGGSAGDYVSGIKLDINNSSSATVSAAAIQAIINVDKVTVA